MDTSLLFPHPAGLPIRHPLRKIVRDFLNVEIQTAGASGHDSMEDSRAPGELVRFKIEREWKHLQSRGWTVKDGVFSKAEQNYGTGMVGEKTVHELPVYMEPQGILGTKRKAEQSPRVFQVKRSLNGLSSWTP